MYAFWAGPAGVVNAAGVARLQQALASGLDVARRDRGGVQAGGDSAPRGALNESYLRENIVYDLGEREQAGLREFYRRAHALSASSPESPELRFHGERLKRSRKKVVAGEPALPRGG